MFTNCEGITIYEKTVVNRAPAYVKHTTGNVYWQPSEGQTDGQDRRSQRSVPLSKALIRPFWSW